MFNPLIYILCEFNLSNDLFGLTQITNLFQRCFLRIKSVYLFTLKDRY